METKNNKKQEVQEVKVETTSEWIKRLGEEAHKAIENLELL